MRARVPFLSLVILSVLLSIDPPAAQAPPAGQMAEGAAVFQKVCSSCHGDRGAGCRALSAHRHRACSPLAAEKDNIIINGMPNGIQPSARAESTFRRLRPSAQLHDPFDLDLRATSPPASVLLGRECRCQSRAGQGAAGGPALIIGRQRPCPFSGLAEPRTIAQGTRPRECSEGWPYPARSSQRRQPHLPRQTSMAVSGVTNRPDHHARTGSAMPR